MHQASLHTRGPQMISAEREISPSNGIRTLTIQRPESTVIETLTLGNGVVYSTDVPITVMPDAKPSSRSPSYVGAIVSGVAAILILLLVVWCCGRKVGRTSSRHSRGSSRRTRSGNSSGSSSSNDSDDASVSSHNGGPGSAVGDMAEGQWNQPAQPMPGMPHPVAGRWAVPPPGFMGPAGMSPAGMGPAGSVGMGMPTSHGGPPMMMGRGGGPPSMHGGPPPPIGPVVGNGGPPLMP